MDTGFIDLLCFQLLPIPFLTKGGFLSVPLQKIIPVAANGKAGDVANLSVCFSRVVVAEVRGVGIFFPN